MPCALKNNKYIKRVGSLLADWKRISACSFLPGAARFAGLVLIASKGAGL